MIVPGVLSEQIFIESRLQECAPKRRSFKFIDHKPGQPKEKGESIEVAENTLSFVRNAWSCGYPV